MNNALNSESRLGGQRTKKSEEFYLLNLKLLLNRIRRLKNSAQMSEHVGTKAPEHVGTEQRQNTYRTISTRH